MKIYELIDNNVVKMMIELVKRVEALK